jgi:RNA polymerase sigma factor (sigma-70 family)
VSLDAPLDDATGTLGDMIECRREGVPDARPQAEEDRAAALELLSRLPRRSAEVLRLRFGFDSEALTLEEIAERAGVSPERVRQVESKGLEKLRRLVVAEGRLSRRAFDDALAALQRHAAS